MGTSSVGAFVVRLIDAGVRAFMIGLGIACGVGLAQHFNVLHKL